MKMPKGQMAPKKDMKKDFDGDFDSSVKGEVEARENTKSMKDSPKKTRGILKTEPRPNKAPEKDKGFLKHTTRGIC